MAKLKAPLLSLGATQQLGKTMVFFPWKGLNVVREYVIPSNPQSAGQTTQRGYVTAAVTMVHTAQALAANMLIAIDVMAYTMLANIQSTPRTWFNEFVKQFVNQRVGALKGAIFRDAVVTPAAGQVTMDLSWTKEGANDITAGNWYYGTSPTALIYTQAGTIAAGRVTDAITPLTAGVKYYFQFRPSAHADFVGVRSGIYTGTPT